VGFVISLSCSFTKYNNYNVLKGAMMESQARTIFSSVFALAIVLFLIIYSASLGEADDTSSFGASDVQFTRTSEGVILHFSSTDCGAWLENTIPFQSALGAFIKVKEKLRNRLPWSRLVKKSRLVVRFQDGFYVYTMDGVMVGVAFI
jgi:hypothetical protein